MLVAVTALRVLGEPDGWQSWLLGFVVAVLGFSVGVGWFSFGAHQYVSDLDPQLDQSVTLQGAVVSVPEVSGDQQSFTLAASSTVVEGEAKALTEPHRLQVFAPQFPRVSYGSVLQLKGELTRPEAFETDLSRQFDYPAYLAMQEVFYVLRAERISIQDGVGGSSVKRGLFSLKRRYRRQVNQSFPSPHAGLLAGMTVGSEDALSDTWEDRFRATGLIHIVVLSGYNVAIVIVAILFILAPLPLAWRLVVAITAVLAFVLLTGAGATIVRAGLMAVLALVARALDRPHQVSRALAIAVAIMVLFNPYLPAFDLSFQLSVLATLGIIYVAPWLENGLLWIPSRGGFREIVAATVGTQIMVFPLIGGVIGEISLISVLANLLVLPVVPLLMLFGFIAALMSVFSYGLALPIIALSYAFLEYILVLVEWLAAVPYATVAIPAIPYWIIGVLYGVFGWIYWRYRHRKEGELTQKRYI